jgi:hypothetical protein
MGKYYKLALVLLYAAQLVIAFREQVVHLYEVAVESIHRHADVHRPAERLEVVKRATHPKYDPVARLSSSADLPPVPLVAAILDHEEEHDDPANEGGEDERKDKARRARRARAREILIANLYPFMRAIRPTAAREDGTPSPMRQLEFGGAACA